MKRRTRSRELALQFLYQLDLRGEDFLPEAEGFLRAEESAKPVRDFALELIHGTMRHRERIDGIIKSVAQNWDIRRMAVIDRNVLRMATFEFLWCQDIPVKVSINEAIELGKRFSTQNSGGFINGVLDKIKDVGSVKDVPTPTPSVAPRVAPEQAEEGDSPEITLEPR